MVSLPFLAATVLLGVAPALANINTFQISQPQQCAPLNISWTSSGSIQATSYNLVLIPTSDQGSVLSNLTFEASGNSYTLPSLPLGKNVEFIAVLQDNVGGANGGRVSQIVTTSGSDGGGTGCLNNLDRTLDFTFSVSSTQPAQCSDFIINWADTATNPVGITGLIPGGEAFNVPITDLANRQATWQMAVPAGTGVLFTMSDAGRKGSGGSTPIYTIASGSSSCLTNGAAVYSSLPVGDVPTTLTVTVTQAGGQTVTKTAQAPITSAVGGGNGEFGAAAKSNTGAIVGGVVGGVLGLLLIIGLVWFFMRRKNKQRDEAITEKHNHNDMTAAGRPWSPPLPSDPEQLDPIYAPTPAFFPSNGSHYRSDSNTSLNSNDAFLAAGGASTPHTFSHVPPGSASSADGGAPSEGRRSTEKRRHLLNSTTPYQGAAVGGGSSMAGRNSDGFDSFAAPSAFGTDGEHGTGEGRDSPSLGGTRFVRHEDAGEVPAGGAGGPEEEVVDLPPLYQDAGSGPKHAAVSGGSDAVGVRGSLEGGH